LLPPKESIPIEAIGYEARLVPVEVLLAGERDVATHPCHKRQCRQRYPR
jgi:hypothetical protein